MAPQMGVGEKPVAVGSFPGLGTQGSPHPHRPPTPCQRSRQARDAGSQPHQPPSLSAPLARLGLPPGTEPPRRGLSPPRTPPASPHLLTAGPAAGLSAGAGANPIYRPAPHACASTDTATPRALRPRAAPRSPRARPRSAAAHPEGPRDVSRPPACGPPRPLHLPARPAGGRALSEAPPRTRLPARLPHLPPIGSVPSRPESRVLGCQAQPSVRPAAATPGRVERPRRGHPAAHPRRSAQAPRPRALASEARGASGPPPPARGPMGGEDGAQRAAAADVNTAGARRPRGSRAARLPRGWREPLGEPRPGTPTLRFAPARRPRYRSALSPRPRGADWLSLPRRLPTLESPRSGRSRRALPSSPPRLQFQGSPGQKPLRSRAGGLLLSPPARCLSRGGAGRRGELPATCKPQARPRRPAPPRPPPPARPAEPARAARAGGSGPPPSHLGRRPVQCVPSPGPPYLNLGSPRCLFMFPPQRAPSPDTSEEDVPAMIRELVLQRDRWGRGCPREQRLRVRGPRAGSFEPRQRRPDAGGRARLPAPAACERGRRPGGRGPGFSGDAPGGGGRDSTPFFSPRGPLPAPFVRRGPCGPPSLEMMSALGLWGRRSPFPRFLFRVRQQPRDAAK